MYNSSSRGEAIVDGRGEQWTCPDQAQTCPMKLLKSGVDVIKKRSSHKVHLDTYFEVHRYPRRIQVLASRNADRIHCNLIRVYLLIDPLALVALPPAQSPPCHRCLCHFSGGETSRTHALSCPLLAFGVLEPQLPNPSPFVFERSRNRGFLPLDNIRHV